MKGKLKLLHIVLLGAAFLMVTTIANGGIKTSKHDLSSTGPGVDLGAGICDVCHTPHSAQASIAPLWDHEQVGGVFTTYGADSATLDATAPATAIAQPSGVSLLCLSCHDGTLGMENFGGTTGGVANLIVGPANLTKDISDDHPVGFTYDDALATADGALWPPTTTVSGISAADHIDDDMLFGGGNDQLECASCHDVHDPTNTPFLRKANTNSDLCLTCHNK